MFRKISLAILLSLTLTGCASFKQFGDELRTDYQVVVAHAKVDGQWLLAELQKLRNDFYKNCYRWPKVYDAWLIFARFSVATDPIEGYVTDVDTAVRAACAFGDPDDLAKAVTAVKQVIAAVKAIQPTSAPQPAPAPVPAK